MCIRDSYNNLRYLFDNLAGSLSTVNSTYHSKVRKMQCESNILLAQTFNNFCSCWWNKGAFLGQIQKRNMYSKNLLQMNSLWLRGSLGDSRKSIFLIGGTQQVPYVTGFYFTAAILSPEGPKIFLLPAWTCSYTIQLKAQGTKSVFSNQHGRCVVKIYSSHVLQGNWQKITWTQYASRKMCLAIIVSRIPIAKQF